MESRYDHRVIEPKIREFWEKNRVFAFNERTTRKIFAVDTPPPTISGAMHLGHAFSYSQQDFMVRFMRMRGNEIYYPFGTDDNGLATDRLIEKMKKVRSADMDRGEYVKLVLKTLGEIRPGFVRVWKDLGISCDFSYYYTTIDDHCRRISQKSFIDLYKMGREYRKEAPTLWCPECRMAIAQVEMKDKELTSSFKDIAFKIGGEDVVIATTRPELLPACVAVFVHPDDGRYKKYVGKKAAVPLMGMEVPVLADAKVDQDKGTGMVMCCTFGDQTDIEWYLEHKLPMRVVLTKDGKMNERAGKYAGMFIKEARKRIIEDLREADLLRGETPIKHMVNTHERCGTEIEILNAKCWFIKYLDLRGEFIKLGGEMRWHPDFMRVRYDNWIKGLKWDWCISRQRHYGVPFPVWYCRKCGEPMLADEGDLPVDPLTDKPKGKCKCGSKDFEPERDVMDTWATSSMSPQLALQLVKDEKTRKRMYPMGLRPQAHDIITFWLFNTVVKSWLHYKTVPWKDIAISGFVLDPYGVKMSKSKGNAIAPEGVIDKCGADALRFWAGGSRLGEDLSYQEKDIVTGQKTMTKLWNASRFLSINIKTKPAKPKKLAVVDRWILHSLNNLIKDATVHFEGYDYSQTKMGTEGFFWREFCDNYLEMIKYRLYGGDDASARYTLYVVLLDILKLFAPIIPYITEEIYQEMFAEHEKDVSIHVSPWPEVREEFVDEEAFKAGELAKKIIAALRQWKAGQKMALNADVSNITIDCSSEDKKIIESVKEDIMGTMKVKAVGFGNAKEVIVEDGLSLDVKL